MEKTSVTPKITKPPEEPISLGAGKAVLIYIENFKDRCKTEEEIRMGMIPLSVIQIGQFIKNNGRLE